MTAGNFGKVKLVMAKLKELTNKSYNFRIHPFHEVKWALLIMTSVEMDHNVWATSDALRGLI